MGAMKRELERLADIVIYGNAETIQREFTKAKGLDDDGGMWVVAYAIELARSMSPLCECGQDYYEWLHGTHKEYIQDTNEQSAEECLHNYGVEKGVSFCLECGEFEDELASAADCNCSQLDDDLAADGWTCYACHATNRDNSRQGTNA